jgi:hypothetical protein
MSNSNPNEPMSFVFNKMNYIMMIAGVVLILLSLVLLGGGGSHDSTFFNQEIFDTQRMVIAPVVMLSGFVLEIVAIMYRPKKNV